MQGARVFVVVEIGRETNFYKASLSGPDLKLFFLHMSDKEVLREVENHVYNRRES